MTKGKDAMPSGGDTPSCSPIRVLGEAIARRALSPRAMRASRPATGEPIVQMDRDQSPQPSNGANPVPAAADQQITFISIPAGGPNEGQRMAPHVHQSQPATSDAESAVSLGATTLTCEGTPRGDEEPAGLMVSHTEPPTDPSIEREIPPAGNLEQPAQAEEDLAHQEQHSGNQAQPGEGLHTQAVLNLLSGVNCAIQVRQSVVLGHIQVPLHGLLPVIQCPDGEGYTTEVEAPTLDPELPEYFTLSPSAPPEFLVDQAFQTKPFEEADAPKASHEDCSNDQLTYGGLD